MTSPIKKFDDLSIWKKGDQRAPHKPLLILYALGRWQNGQAEVTYLEVERDLTALLQNLARQDDQTIQSSLSGDCRTMAFGR